MNGAPASNKSKVKIKTKFSQNTLLNKNKKIKEDESYNVGKLLSLAFSLKLSTFPPVKKTAHPKKGTHFRVKKYISPIEKEKRKDPINLKIKLSIYEIISFHIS